MRENIVLALQARRGVFRHLSPRASSASWRERFIAALGIRTADAETPIGAALRRQPAEGHARALAGHRAARC